MDSLSIDLLVTRDSGFESDDSESGRSGPRRVGMPQCRPPGRPPGGPGPVRVPADLAPGGRAQTPETKTRLRFKSSVAQADSRKD
jgi:hypothetical protein